MDRKLIYHSDYTKEKVSEKVLPIVQYGPPSQKQHRFEANDLEQVLSLLLSVNPDLAKQLRLKQLDNDTLFNTYFDELKFRQLSHYYINRVIYLLLKFKDYLGEAKPTIELAQTFLTRYVDHSPRTFITYYTYVQGIMTWYGIKLEFKVKAPKYSPPYYSEAQVERLLEASKHKKTHKKLAIRDTLLIKLAITSGMRRSELASLKVGDFDFATNRVKITGKGNKKRTIPLMNRTAEELKRYCRDKNPNESLFGLKPECISNKIRQLSKKAGVNLQTHSLRHYFGTRLVEKGANISAVQEGTV